MGVVSVVLIIIIESSRGSFAQLSYGFQTQQRIYLARNSCLNTSTRLECAICGRGAKFPQASARRCLTFPLSVYSAHWSFSSPTRCMGLADSPPVDYVLPKLCIIMVDYRHRLDFASWLVCPDFPTLHSTNFDFV